MDIMRISVLIIMNYKLRENTINAHVVGVKCMASSKEYLEFILEQLSGLDEITSRAMMGEYVL